MRWRRQLTLGIGRWPYASRASSDWICLLVETAKLLASDGAADEFFGWSVALSGDRALISAPTDDENGSAAGSAYVFDFDGISWTESAKLLASDGAERDQFGFSVSLSGDRALIGAPFDDDNGFKSGAAYVFSFNAAPVAVDDAYNTDEDQTLTVAAPGVLANDTDDGDALSAVLVSGPANGTLTLNSDGSFTYTPNSNFNGSDSFTYQASDGSAESNTATVSITVNPVNDPPTADAGGPYSVRGRLRPGGRLRHRRRVDPLARRRLCG